MKHKIRKELAVVVIILFIGMSVFASSGKIVEKSSVVFLDEDFSGSFPPEGWSTDWWTQYNSSCGGSEPPCALLYRGDFNNAYITSKAVDAGNYEKFFLRFRFGAWGEHYSVYFKIRVNETSPWKNYTFWDNPIQEDLIPVIYEIEIDLEPGGCADAFQINWTIYDNFFGLQDACLDDVKICSSTNNPPDAPTIQGQKIFKEGEEGEYTYTIYSTDPDDDELRYLIDWGDNVTEWIGFYESGVEVSLNITVPSLDEGNYDLFKVKALDVFGGGSNWTILEITVPKNHNLIWWLNGLLDRFPLLSRLLGWFKW